MNERWYFCKKCRRERYEVCDDENGGEMMPPQTILLILLAGGMLLLIAAATHFSGQGSLNNIKSKTVGDGQHGTARWATKKEIQQTYQLIPFRPAEWRRGKNLPKAQGLVLGCMAASP